MSEQRTGGPFDAVFTYTEAVLSDFETLYLQKKEISPATRVALGLVGAAGAVYFGLQLVRVGYLVICSIMLVVALSGGGKRPDDTPAKYRKYYLGKQATFHIDENGVEMKLEGQKNFARSRFREVYSLIDTDLCFYFVVKGKAYYILPKNSVGAPGAEELVRYMQKKCAKRFQHYELDRG